MRLSLLTLVSSVLVTFSAATPTHRPSRRINPFQDVLLFDAPAFQNPTDSGQTLVALQAFVSLRQIDLGILTSGVEKGLSALGVDVGDKISSVMDRLKLFGAVGLPGQEVEVDVSGCSSKAVLSGTSGLPDLGMSLQNVSLGQCGSELKQLEGITVSSIDNRKFTAKIFSSPSDGFGVISDIDDTVKVSNVLDKIKLVQATLLDEPEPVAGMPELYASLASKLDSPQFIYITGSPFQLYPFLRDFIDTSFSASNGPIFMQNLTLVDVAGLLDFAKSDGVFEYKSAMIDRIKGMYPNKKFVAIGDSTQKDPETYGEAFRKYGDFITCSLIRKVDGADNTDERFDAAFRGVPAANFKIFDDADIEGLANINVASGTC